MSKSSNEAIRVREQQRWAEEEAKKLLDDAYSDCADDDEIVRVTERGLLKMVAKALLQAERRGLLRAVEIALLEYSAFGFKRSEQIADAIKKQADKGGDDE